jgi:hypothetical protein
MKKVRGMSILSERHSHYTRIICRQEDCENYGEDGDECTHFGLKRMGCAGSISECELNGGFDEDWWLGWSG